jgi:redox-sensitive bicupin YhaK (pirin superfamily)
MPQLSSAHASQAIHAPEQPSRNDELVPTTARKVVLRTRGDRHGPITRVFSPSDLGHRLKPFVFLDYVDFTTNGGPMFPMHPHSGIATITILLSNDIRYEDTTGASGVLKSGSVEWMNAGGGVWHDGYPINAGRLRAYQLWVALPAAIENGPAQSQYLPPGEVPQVGGARLILGDWQGHHSPVLSPPGMNYLHVKLPRGERWRYVPPPGHTVAWLHVSLGALAAGGSRVQSELVMFEESGAAIDVLAEEDTEFVLGSAVKHPHELVLGYYSVHTSAQALRDGESGIARIGQQLRSAGRL